MKIFLFIGKMTAEIVGPIVVPLNVNHGLAGVGLVGRKS